MCIEEDRNNNVGQSKLTNCVTDYINERLGCTLPWTADEVNKTENMTYCHSYEHVSYIEYSVTQVVWHKVFVDLDLGCSTILLGQ